MTELTELQSADAYCRYLARNHYENFSVLSLFLPRSARLHLARIYAFCRTTDDLGDESGEGGPQSLAMKRLEQWREEVVQVFADQSPPIHPVLIALSRTVRECLLPPNPFLDLIQANMQDQVVPTYETWEQVKDYCMLSAAPVGRLVLRVFGIDDPRATALSDDVCIGLQIANHAQDVRRDAARGRTYIPSAEMGKGGIRCGVRSMCDRAEALLGSGRSLEVMAPLPLRAQLALYRLGGLEVVSRIRRVGYGTEEVRPTVSALRKAQLLPRAIVDSVTRIEHAAPQRTA